jgi:hypothetical protein
MPHLNSWSTTEPMQFRLRLAHLYPNLMNIYGDRGNILTLRRRCERRNIDLVVDSIGLDEPFDAEHYDLLFVGGGQDREQHDDAARVAERLRRRGAEGAAEPAAVAGRNVHDAEQGDHDDERARRAELNEDGTTPHTRSSD